jgi:hypothetical protein
MSFHFFLAPFYLPSHREITSGSPIMPVMRLAGSGATPSASPPFFWAFSSMLLACNYYCAMILRSMEAFPGWLLLFWSLSIKWMGDADWGR